MINKLTKNILAAVGAVALVNSVHAQEMDKMWGESVIKLRPEDAKRGQLFADGNYAMFIHWGLYSHLANKVDGKTYYGIGEWIMNPQMANIPPVKYKEIAKDFNPVNFDAKAVAQLAKDAGMKYIIITSKHHDGFAMYHSKANDFNIIDATSFKRDPMKELAAACKEVGIGFGFYYSHNQDWTYPGGNGGPTHDAEGKAKSFADYFNEKCFDQVNEITTEYGPIEIVWFDTPGDMPKEHVQKLCDLVYKNQPNAFISGRAGHGLGDYQSLGDMEIPLKNVEGLWEGVDTTNDSWAFAWYDENYKTPKNVLERVIATVARGGTYMLNVGLKGDGSIPERAAYGLRGAGDWIKKHPKVVYGTDASPWGHALPWGDATVKGNTVFLSVFNWPGTDGLYLPGLKTKVKSAKLYGSDKELAFEEKNGWVKIALPSEAPDKLVSVVEVEMDGKPEADHTHGLDPNVTTHIEAAFATATEQGVKKGSANWMEKFGEWKHVYQFSDWSEGGAAIFEVDVLEPGTYHVDLKYAGKADTESKGRLVWKVEVEGGETMQNQQNSSHNFASFPIGWTNFTKAGKHKIKVSCIEGEIKAARLSGISFTRVP